MNIFKILVNEILIVLSFFTAAISKRYSSHIKKIQQPYQKDTAAISKRITILNLYETYTAIKLTIIKLKANADKICIISVRKKHLYIGYRKRIQKSRGSFG